VIFLLIVGREWSGCFNVKFIGYVPLVEVEKAYYAFVVKKNPTA
jgi:hypothetical protein